MKGLTFVLNESHELAEETTLGYKEIKVLDRSLMRTRPCCNGVVFYDYILDTIADGDYLPISEDDFLEEVACGIYKLKGQP